MRLVTLSVGILLILSSYNLSAKENTFLFQPDNANFLVYGYGENSYIISQSKLTEMKLNDQMSQLSSGKRINNASDDPAGLAVAEKMNSLLKELRQESMNSEDMRNFHNFIESAIAEDQELLKRIRLLIVQASNGIFNSDDRGYIQSEIEQLLSQINLNAKFLQFNTMAIIPELTTGNLGLNGVDVVHNVQNSLGLVDDAMTMLMTKRVVQGVKSNILTFKIEGKSYQFLNLQRSESNISDINMAEGITELIKNSVLFKAQHGLIIRSR